MAVRRHCPPKIRDLLAEVTGKFALWGSHDKIGKGSYQEKVLLASDSAESLGDRRPRRVVREIRPAKTGRGGTSV